MSKKTNAQEASKPFGVNLQKESRIMSTFLLTERSKAKLVQSSQKLGMSMTKLLETLIEKMEVVD